MIVEVGFDVTFSFQDKGEYGSISHMLTIWEDGGGYIEIQMSDKELEKLRSVLK